jgi:AraC family transcriptional regulator
MIRTGKKSTFSLLNTDYVQLNSKWNYKNVTSTFYRMYMIDEGHGQLFNLSNSLTLEKGYLYLIPSFTTCNYFCPEYLSQYYISFIEDTPDGISLFASNSTIFKIECTAEDLVRFERIIQLNPHRGLTRSHNPGDYEKQPILEGFRELNNRTPLWAQMETEGIIQQLFSRFLKSVNFHPANTKHIHSKILDAINFIQTNLHQNITVADLASRAIKNPDYFSRLFRENTGEKPLTYIQHKRIERAQFLLNTTDLSFSEIAAATGFENPSYFCRIFKNLTGQTPKQFKQNSVVI